VVGAGLGPSQKADWLSGSLHGWNGHSRSLVPNTGGTGSAGTAVLWFLARAECGLEEEHCAAAGERRGGGGQRREEKRREILIGANQDEDLFFFCCDSLVFSNKKFCLWFSLAGVDEETKS